jgi:hypothetical protein
MHWSRLGAVGLFVCAGVAAASDAARAQGPAKDNATLACEGGAFSKFRLKNTKGRSYQPDSFSGRRCELTDKAEGVIWVATGEGHALQGADKKLVFKDERGRQFGHTCWTSSGTINDVTQTEIILFGPQDSKTITVCCGERCANARLE